MLTQFQNKNNYLNIKLQTLLAGHIKVLEGPYVARGPDGPGLWPILKKLFFSFFPIFALA